MGKVYRVTEEDDDSSGIGAFIAIGVIIFIVGIAIKLLAYVLPIAAVVGIIIWIVKSSKKSKEKQRYNEKTNSEDAFNKINQYHGLLKNGVITQNEYDIQKKQSLKTITIYMKNSIYRNDENAKKDAINKLNSWHSLFKNKAITKEEYEYQKELCLKLMNN